MRALSLLRPCMESRAMRPRARAALRAIRDPPWSQVHGGRSVRCTITRHRGLRPLAHAGSIARYGGHGKQSHVRPRARSVAALRAVRVTRRTQWSCSEKKGGDGRTFRSSAVAQ
jgi:hypothetical protein